MDVSLLFIIILRLVGAWKAYLLRTWERGHRRKVCFLSGVRMNVVVHILSVVLVTVHLHEALESFQGSATSCTPCSSFKGAWNTFQCLRSEVVDAARSPVLYLPSSLGVAPPPPAATVGPASSVVGAVLDFVSSFHPSFQSQQPDDRRRWRSTWRLSRWAVDGGQSMVGLQLVTAFARRWVRLLLP